MLPERIQYVEEARGCEFYPGCSYQVMFRYEDSGGMIQRNVTIPGKFTKAHSRVVLCLST